MASMVSTCSSTAPTTWCDQEDRHLAVERLRHRGALRPGRRQRSPADDRAVVDVGLCGDPPAATVGPSSRPRWRLGRAGCASSARVWCTGRSGEAWPGTLRRLAALPRASRLRSRSTSVHGLGGRFRGRPGRPRPEPSERRSSPVGIAHPDPVPFTELLTSFAASMGRPRPRFVPTPPMAVYSGAAGRRALAGHAAGPSRLPPRARPAGTGRAAPRGPRTARGDAAAVRPAGPRRTATRSLRPGQSLPDPRRTFGTVCTQPSTQRRTCPSDTSSTREPFWRKRAGTATFCAAVVRARLEPPNRAPTVPDLEPGGDGTRRAQLHLSDGAVGRARGDGQLRAEASTP